MKRRCKKESAGLGALSVPVLAIIAGLCLPINMWAAEIQGIVQLEKQGVVVDGDTLPTGGRVSVMLFPMMEQEARKKVPEIHDMIIKGKRVDPIFTTITVGDSVRFINQDGMMHHLNVVSDKSPFEVMLGKKDGGSATAIKEFAEKGSWYLYCRLHHSLFGQIDVVSSSYVQNLKSGNKFIFSEIAQGKWQVRATTLDNIQVVTEAEAFTAPPMLELTLKIGANTGPGTGIKTEAKIEMNEAREADHAHEVDSGSVHEGDSGHE